MEEGVRVEVMEVEKAEEVTAAAAKGAATVVVAETVEGVKEVVREVEKARDLAMPTRLCTRRKLSYCVLQRSSAVRLRKWLLRVTRCSSS
jgi:hypothetical protein